MSHKIVNCPNISSRKFIRIFWYPKLFVKYLSQFSADLPDAEALSTPKRGFIQRSYKYRQPYMRARPRADRIQVSLSLF